MRTVFTNSMCAHVWAQLSQPHGRSGSMKFDGAVAYSYQTPIAHLIKPYGADTHVALFVPNIWGVTTGKHLSEYRDATRGRQQFEVPEIFAGYKVISVRDEPADARLHVVNVEYLREQYIKERDALMRCPADSWRLSATDEDYADGTLRHSDQPSRAHVALRKLAIVLEGYARAFGIECAALPWKIDADMAIARRDRILADPKRAAKQAAAAVQRDKARALKEARDAEARRVALLESAERVKLWRDGADVRLQYQDRNPDDIKGSMLRLRGDVVETSMGAEAPATHVRLALAFYKRVRNGCEPRTYERDKTGASASVRLGHFTLDRIDADGNVCAGCHYITAAEVQRLSQVFGI